jgi:hypothetical protein
MGSIKLFLIFFLTIADETPRHDAYDGVRDICILGYQLSLLVSDVPGVHDYIHLSGVSCVFTIWI